MLVDSHFTDPLLQTVCDPFLDAKGLVLKVLRLDLVHPLVSGNKWFKLKENLAMAHAQDHDTLLSYGGAYSNHLIALAAAAKLNGLRSIGVVRGELIEPLNPALAFMKAQGMVLHPVSRSDYRHKEDAGFKADLQAQYGPYFDIPEGGGNSLGLQGAAQISSFIKFSPSALAKYVFLACGTGATMAGILSSLKGADRVLGVSVLKGEDTLSPQIQQWLEAHGPLVPCAWEILRDYHCGGYAKSTPALRQRMHEFSLRSGIPLEPVYTAKMIDAIYTLAEQGFFPLGSELIAIHTGGLVAN